jgi:hypothetical protein
VAESTAAAILAVVGLHLWANMRALRSQTDASRQALASGLAPAGTSLGSLAAVDLSGRIAWGAPGAAGRFVMFVVHKATARRDLEFWRDVSARLGGAAWLKFAGYCEEGACDKGDQAGSSITLIQAGQVRTTQSVLRADRDGEAVLAAANAQVVADIPWQGRSTGAVADDIVAAR